MELVDVFRQLHMDIYLVEDQDVKIVERMVGIDDETCKALLDVAALGYETMLRSEEFANYQTALAKREAYV